MSNPSYSPLQRAIVWLMIALMASPLPAVAQVVSNTAVRDTAIYLGAAPGTNPEPNVLLVLGTNDRMNIPEPWREMPGAYDSHIEYLWADVALIIPNNWSAGLDWSNPAQQGELPGHPIAWGQSGGISMMAQPTNPVSPWGNWAGNSVNERFNLAVWAYYSAAFTGAWANAIATDPGPRFLYRNYGGGGTPASTAPWFPRPWTGDSNWLWWAPAGTAETSPLLWAPSFNKFAGGSTSVGGTRGGITFGNDTGWTTRNQCQASYPQLTPSTVFAPSAFPRNSGRFMNQVWQRWEPFLDLDTTRVASFPANEPPASWGGRRVRGGSGTESVNSVIWPRAGYADSNLASPTLVMEGGPDYWPWWAGPFNLFPLQNPGNGDRGWAAYGNGERWIFQSPGAYGAPIRMLIDNGTPGVVEPGDSRSGWSNLRADLGGYNLWWSGIAHLLEDAFAAFPGYKPQSPLPRVLQNYGIAVASSTPDAQMRFAAMRGNRDVGGTDWWRVTGIGAYFSTSLASGSISASSATLTIDRNNAFWPGQRINVPGAGPAGALMVATISAVGGVGNRTLTLSSAAATTVSNTPIAVNMRLNNRNSAVCTRTCNNTDGTTPASNGSVDADGRDMWYRPASSGCTNGGVSDGGSGACATATPDDCGPQSSDNRYQTVRTSGCTWTGRQSVFVEGVGTVTHGGTCVASCTERFPHVGTCSAGATSATYCGAPSATDRTFNGVTYANAVINGGGNGSGTGCGGVNVGSASLNCTTREGTPCVYRLSCNNQQAWDDPPFTDFSVVNRARFAGYLVHDCVADNGTAANFGGFLNTRADRSFGAEWNSTVSAAANNSAAYSPTDPGIAAPAIDVYSNNYLNWRFGPRGPNGHPIGRATRLTTAKSALSDVVMATNGVRMGLMVTNRTRADLTNDGGNIAFAIRRMGTDAGDPDHANRQLLVNAISSVVASSRTPLTETVYEAMLYFNGRTPQWGTDTSPAFIGGTASQGRDPTAVCTAITPDCPSLGVYRSPMLSNPDLTRPMPASASCQKNFMVVITNGVPEDDWSANTLPGNRGVRNMAYDSVSPQQVGTVSPVQGVDSFNPATPSNQFINPATNLPYGLLDQGSTAFDAGYLWLDELAYFMANSDISPGSRIFTGDTGTDGIGGFQPVLSYFIGFKGAASPVVQQAALRGDGLYYEAQDASDLRNRLQQALTNITGFTGTIAAATVPLSAYNRGQSSLDVYLAFFEPSANQFWRGTLKKYRLGLTPAECGLLPDGTPNDLCLTGQTDLGGGVTNIAVQEPLGATGLFIELINTLAVSFWNPLSEIDGRNPARGGTGYQLMSQGVALTPENRRVYTKLSSVMSTDLTAVANRVHGANAAITAAILGVPNTFNDRYRVLNFLRGGSMADAQCNGAQWWLPCNSWSTWPHADVLHSKPSQVYYDVGTTPPQQTVFYMTNDGLLRAVNANTGVEQWAFLVEEALPRLSAMLANGAGEQIQAADGSPTVYINDVNGNGVIEAGDQVIVTFGLRRGGRSLYALDVTNINTPRFLWKITGEGGGQLCTGACTSQPTYAEIGQTWSDPVVGRVAGNVNPVAIFGAGYDPNQDNEPVTVADTMGRAVFVVDLLTGVPIRRFDSSNVLVNGSPGGAMPNSVPSFPTVLDINGDGLLDRIYIGDTAANLFRFQITDPAPANWAGKLLARLSNATPANRKILFAPSVVRYTAGGSRLSAIFVGTGDREHPFKISSSDILAMIVDRDNGNTLSVSPPVLYDDVSFIKMPWDDLSAQANVGAGATGWARTLPATVKTTESLNVQNDVIRAPVYGRASALGYPEFTSTCTPSFISRMIGYAGLDGRIITLPGNTAGGQFFQTSLSQNYLGASQVLFLPDGRIIIVSSGGAVGLNREGGGGVIGQIGVPRTRVYWFLEPN
jgi:hypothetical protein